MILIRPWSEGDAGPIVVHLSGRVAKENVRLEDVGMSRSKDPIGAREHKLQWFTLKLEQTIKHFPQIEGTVLAQSGNRRGDYCRKRRTVTSTEGSPWKVGWGMGEREGGKDVRVRRTSSGLSRGIWFQPLSTVRDRSVRSRSVRLLFSKPFLALLQVFIEKHRQVPDHERQHNPGKELGRVSKLCF